MTLQELQVVITAKTSGLKNELKGVEKSLETVEKKTKSVTNSMASAFKKVGAAVAAIGIGKLVADATNDAIKFEANMSTIRMTLGKNAADFEAWAYKNAASFGISRMEAAKYGNTFSNLVSGFTSDTSQMTGYTIKLLEAAAVVATRTGRTTEDVLERFRSGMLGSTEAIEDLGIQVKVSTIETTDAFKKIADGKPWASLNAQQQQAIMTMAILEQSARKYGTALAGGPITSMVRLRAELSNLKLQLGQAFIPIVTTVIPYLQTFIHYVGTALIYLTAFTKALFGVTSAVNAVGSSSMGMDKAAGDSADVNKNMAGSAASAKKIKGALAGIDELNNIKQDDGGSAGGGGAVVGEIDIPNFEDTSLNQAITNFNQQVDDIQKKIQKVLPWVGLLGAALGGLWLAANFTGIAAGFALLAEKLAPSGLYANMNLLQKAFLGISTLLSSVSLPVFLAIAAVIGLVIAAVVSLWRDSESFRNSWIEVWENIKKTLKNIYDTIIQPILMAVVAALIMIWEGGLKPLWDSWKALWEQISGLLTDILNGIVFPIMNQLIDWLGPKVVPFIQGLALAFGAMVTAVLGIMKSLLDSITTVIAEVRKIFSGIIDFVKGTFTGNWKLAWEGVKKVFSGVMSTLPAVFKAPLNAIIGMVNAVIKGINSLLSFKVPSWMSKFGVKSGTIGVNLPMIPKLAQGGIVDTGTLFMAGEAGKEVVMPLENNTGWITELATMLNGQMGGSDKKLDIILQVGSTEFGRVAIDSINKLTRQEGRLLLQV